MSTLDGIKIGPIGEDDLQAFVDGRLEEARNAVIEAWLAAHPDEARAVKSDMLIRASLRAAAEAQIEPIPTSMRLAELRRANADSNRAPWRRMAAAIVLLAIGGASGWAVRDGLTPVSTVGTMADATAAWRVFANDQIQPVEFSADNRVRLASWVSGQVGRSIDIPDLGEAGLEFMGGRLLSADAGPAGMFLYEDAEKQRFIFYVRATTGERPKGLQIRVSQGIETRFWFDGRHGYALAGPAHSPRLAAATEAVRRSYPGNGG